ncbi:MAG: ABC transporter permease subunit [Actinomycetota bacterium]|nr:ABC transporter permease subunit [Actinomycetota bacterium]
MKKAVIIFKKEIKEIIKNKNIWLPVLIVVIIFSVAMPMAFILGSVPILEDEDTMNFINKAFGSVDDPLKVLIDFILKQLIILLLLIPAMVPSLIAPSSVLMEKENKTLEPLLATPVRTSELLLGKTLTALVPSFITSTICFIILTVVVDITAFIKLGYLPLPTIEWLIVAFILSPILSFIITMLSIIVSSKSTDIKGAQGIGSMVILPIYLVIGLQLAGIFLINIAYLLIGCLVLLAFCPLFLKLAVKVFDRENIITKWKMKT